MKDQMNKIKILENRNNSIFREIFGFGKKDNKEEVLNNDVYEDNFIVVHQDWSIEFKKTGSFIRKPLPGYSNFLRLNWEDKALNWLLNADFIVNMAQMDQGYLTRFVNGKWYKGNFRGRAFIDSKFGVENGNEAYFEGGKFINSEWLPSPYYFVDGVTDEKNSVLGKKNIHSLNQRKFKFNIISVLPGKRIIIEQESGIKHEIIVLKRLDSKNSNFEYRIKNGENGKVFKTSLRWSTIRANSEEEFERMTTFSNSHIPDLFTEIFELPFNSEILKVFIGDNLDFGKEVIENPGHSDSGKSESELSKTQQFYDLSKVPFLGIKKLQDEEDGYYENGVRLKNLIARVFFNAPNNDYLQKFDEVTKNLDNNILSSDFMQLKDYISNGVLTGAPKEYPWLANLIGQDTKNPKLEENFKNTLSRIEDFLKYFVNRVVKYAGKARRSKGDTSEKNEKIINLIKDNIRKFLGINIIDSSDEKRPEDSPKRNIPLIKAPGAKNEVRNLVHKILIDNMKHF